MRTSSRVAPPRKGGATLSLLIAFTLSSAALLSVAASNADGSVARPAPPGRVPAPQSTTQGATQGATRGAPPLRTVEAPDFALETMTGETFRLSDQRGKIVVLNFWATWCPPCRREMPDFIALQDEFREQGILFAGVSLDEEGWAVVRPFAESLPTNYPIMVDDGTAEAAFAPIRVMPTTFIIDGQGTLQYYAPGMLTEELLRPILLDLLAARDAGD